MMRTILLLLFLFGHSWSCAQQWRVPGATWYYSMYASNHYRKYVYTGDTLIDGVTGNVIRFNVSDGPWINPTHVTRAEDDVIYKFQDFPEWDISRWDTIIWFGATPGDHWEHLDFVDLNCGCLFNVVDTGHVDLGGQWLRTIDVINPCFSENQVYRYIERIGSAFGLFFEHCYDTELYREPPLRCYSDEGMNYTSGFTPDCDWGVGVQEQEGAAVLGVFPNPSDGLLQVNVSDPNWRVASITVLDGQGRTAPCLQLPKPPSCLTCVPCPLVATWYGLQTQTAGG